MAYLRRTIALLGIGTLAACATGGNRLDYGVPALATEHFYELDSAVAAHVGATVSVLVQEEVGAMTPARRTRQGSFSGVLQPMTTEYLVLMAHEGDTIAIGKGHVLGVYLRPGIEHSNSAAPLIGALILGVATAVTLNKPGENLSLVSKITLIPAAALLGAFIGSLFSPQEAEGEQIFPLVVHHAGGAPAP